MTNLVGLHDREATVFAPNNTWILDTIALSENPQPHNYSPNHHWIVRVNWGYGSTGTIPFGSGHETLFLERLYRYILGSKNCARWIIGNEPNLPREWPNGQPILPQIYAKFYRRCRAAIKNINKDYETLIAASGPWNAELKYQGNQNGDWIKYFTDVIGYCDGEIDGFSIHAYTHGYDPNLVNSVRMMDAPFANRYYDFYTYKNYLLAIPDEHAKLPVYLTEANGNGPWQAVGLMPRMADEINYHNSHSSDRKIKSLIFYRWPRYDEFYIEGKQDVMNEFKQAVAKNYSSPVYLPVISAPQPTPQVPEIVLVPSAPQATVKATLLNVRNAPGPIGSVILGQIKQGEKISILEEKNIDGLLWYRIGAGQWVAAEWVERSGQPVADKWQRCKEFTLGWEGGFQDVDWDIGNWTGCEVGKGIKKGTNFGISACAYPNLDIRNITREQAHQIYFRDYWVASGAADLEWPLCLLVFDSAVNFGTTVAAYWLKESKGNPYLYIAFRLRGYRKSKSWPQAGNAWIDRTVDLLLEAGE